MGIAADGIALEPMGPATGTRGRRRWIPLARPSVVLWCAVVLVVCGVVSEDCADHGSPSPIFAPILLCEGNSLFFFFFFLLF